jgi:hypothetical protein
MRYTEFLDYLGLPKNKRSTPTKSDEDMLEDLRLISLELDRTPTTQDLVNRAGVCGKGTYVARFTSWSNALKLAGIKPIWCPVSNEELIGELRRFRAEQGRSPTTRDKLSYGWATFSTRFGTWSKALEAADIPVNESAYGTRTEGRDGVLYDSISESIVANWLFDNGVEYESHVPYFDKLIADFKVGPYFVEFFGMPNLPAYAARMRLKRFLCRRHGYVLIEIFPEDLAKLDEKLAFLKEGYK